MLLKSLITVMYIKKISTSIHQAKESKIRYEIQQMEMVNHGMHAMDREANGYVLVSADDMKT